tara:strand:- start:76 stop:273 length:198 start_codon:yes stop_codon:yes gene_type:complete
MNRFTAENRALMLGAIQAYCPDEQTKKGFVKLIDQLEKDGFTEKELVSEMISMLLGGLKYGNWHY